MKPNHTHTGHTASSTTALRAGTGLARCASVILIATFLISFLIFGSSQAQAQASITSPSSNEALPVPTFTLQWNNVGQTQTYIWIGAQQRTATYYAGMGTGNSATFTWSNAPASCWITLWSWMWAPVYTGTAQSTVAYWAWQWVPRDYFYRIGQTSTKTASDRLIDSWLQRFQSDNGVKGGQCKAYLQNSFWNVAVQTGVRTPGGAVPFMPASIAGYYWAQDWNSAFTEVLKVYPGDANKLDAIKAMLRQVKKGDVIQYGTQVTVNEGLHSLAITADYDAASGNIRWADSNWKSDEIVNAYQSRSVNDLATIIANNVTLSNPAGTYPKGATLYRVRRDLK